MTPRDRIATLLHHYRDVCDGIPNLRTGGCGDGCALDPKDRWLCSRYGCDDERVLALMCEEWNHPSYQQLERLLVVMQERWPRIRQAVRSRYERYSERRVAWCPRCGVTNPAQRIGDAHKNPCRDRRGNTVEMREKIVRVLPVDDRPELIADALDWLERHWTGEVDLPDSIIAYATAALQQDAA